MINKSIYENGDGGALRRSGNDLMLTRSIYEMVYIALFGGNVEEVTTGEDKQGEFHADWWGNNKSGNPREWVNSKTEKALLGATITNQTAIEVKKAILEDIEQFKHLGEQEVEVWFPNLNHIKIKIKIKQPENTSDISFIWDNTRNEAIITELI